MDYERKYKLALERAREQYNKRTPLYDIEYIFPELAESEDERMRKEIIDFLKLPHPQFVGKRDHEKWSAWLEKQGEKLDADKVIEWLERALPLRPDDRDEFIELFKEAMKGEYYE